jgi:hypothetical protein
MASEARTIVESALGNHMTAKIWTGNYAPVFPFTPQQFAIGSLMPMILYLFRWGHRRGRGKFDSAFSPAVGKPTVRSVAERLALNGKFEGFETEVGQTILGDLLLTAILENRRHAEGQDEQVQRCFAPHYMASWIDLPTESAHLRGVPEMIVALIADQRKGLNLELDARNGRYPVGARIHDNEFVASFAPGVNVEGELRTNLRSDKFDEAANVGLDQLLTIRIAQQCGEAPSKAVGKGQPGPIPNQRPIAIRAASQFRSDFLVFFDSYGRNGIVPRLSLLPMLETAIAIGLTTIILSTVHILEKWIGDGRVPEAREQRPWEMFIDCSGSADPQLRDLSEQSGDLVSRQLQRVSLVLMYMRLLDFFVMTESELPSQKDGLPSESPEATDWLDLLGRIAQGNHSESRDAEKFFRNACRKLVQASDPDQPTDLRIDILGNESDGRPHGVRLAEALTLAFEKSSRNRFQDTFLSALMVDEPNGLARRRRIVLRKALPSGRKTTDATSFVLTNTALEYLVHRHLRHDGKGRKPRELSFPDFLTLLRERYGYHIDQPPPNMTVPNELLQRNRRVLERRLRDLGLLAGVNDAERMKKLRARFGSMHDTVELTEAGQA